MLAIDRLFPLLLILSGSLLYAQTGEAEPNDRPEQAQLITLGQEVAGDLTAGDQDWFRFSTAGGNIPLYLNGDGATAVDARLTLFDAKGSTMLAFNDDTRGVLPALNLNLESGTYLLRIDGFSATSSGRYILDTAENPFHPYTDVEVEPNDDFAHAMTVRLDSEVEGRIGPTDQDVDFYRVVLPAGPGNPARYGLWIQVTDGEVPCVSRPRLEFYDAAQAPLNAAVFGPAAVNASDFDFRISEFRCWTAGTYYIKVLRSTSTAPGPIVPTGYYRLELRALPMNVNGLVIEPGAPPTPPEPPGTHDFAHAVPLPAGARAIGALQTMPSGAIEEDHWLLDITQPTVVMFQSANLNGSGQELADTTLTVLDPNERVVAFSRQGNILEPPTTSHARLAVRLELPGQYRLRVAAGPGAPLTGERDYVLEVGVADMPYVGAVYVTADTANDGCIGSNGLRPTLAGREASPHFPLAPLAEREVATMGTVFRRRVQDLPPGALFLLIDANFLLPTPLTSPSAPGCSVNVPFAAARSFTAGLDGTFVVQDHIPFIAGVRGLPMYEQVIVFDPTANALGVTVSNPGLWIVGDRAFN
jgi:hypothetical protein